MTEGRAKRYPTWKYRYFRLRFKDCNFLPDEKDRLWGIAWYSEGARYDWNARVQVGVMTGRYEYIFDLWKRRD